MPAALRLKARECIAAYVQKANERLGAQLPMPTCSFDLRGKTAGKALSGRRGRGTGPGLSAQPVLHVQLNSVLFQENVQSFLQDTIPHEVAHLVTRQLYGRGVASHGPEWQRVMRTLGVEPRRTHQYDVSNAAVASRLYRFSCACRTFELTPRKARAALQGLRACRQCKSVLAYSGEARIDQQWQAFPLRALLHVEHIREGGVTAGVNPAALGRKPAKAGRSPPLPKGAPAPTPTGALGFGGPPKPPSPALLSYMEDLARRLNLAVPEDARQDREKASLFVDLAKAVLLQKRSQAPAPSTGAPAAQTAPTEKQLAYAQAIAARKGLAIPQQALLDKATLSRWIDAHRSA